MHRIESYSITDAIVFGVVEFNIQFSNPPIRVLVHNRREKISFIMLV